MATTVFAIYTAEVSCEGDKCDEIYTRDSEAVPCDETCNEEGDSLREVTKEEIESEGWVVFSPELESDTLTYCPLCGGTN